MSIDLQTCHDLYSSASVPQVNLLVTITAPAAPAVPSSTAAVPTSLVCVLDVSGSMQGAKMDEMKATMEYIVSTLTALDSLAIVSFNDRANVLFPLTRMNSNLNSKTQATSIIAGLQANGGTSILAGLDSGVECLEMEADPRAIKSVLLLTDGQEGTEDIQRRFGGVLARVRASGSTLNTFGFGRDHDARVMAGLAEKGGGLFSYVESTQDIGNAFAACLATLKSTLTKDLALDVEVPEGAALASVEEVPSEQASGGGGGAAAMPAAPQPWEPPSPDQVGGAVQLLRASTAYPSGLRPRSLRITFGALAAGEKRAVVVQLSLPPTSPQAHAAAAAAGRATTTHYIVSAKVAYTALATGLLCALPPAAATVARATGGSAEQQAARVAAAGVSLEVEAARARDQATAVLAAALRLAEDNNYGKAAASLGEEIARLQACAAAAHPLVTGLVSDLGNLLRSCSSREGFEMGGRAGMSSLMGSHVTQRFSGVSSPTSSSSAAYCSPSQHTAMGNSPSARHAGPRAAQSRVQAQAAQAAQPTDPTAGGSVAWRGGPSGAGGAAAAAAGPGLGRNRAPPPPRQPTLLSHLGGLFNFLGSSGAPVAAGNPANPTPAAAAAGPTPALVGGGSGNPTNPTPMRPTLPTPNVGGAASMDAAEGAAFTPALAAGGGFAPVPAPAAQAQVAQAAQAVQAVQQAGQGTEGADPAAPTPN